MNIPVSPGADESAMPCGSLSHPRAAWIAAEIPLVLDCIHDEAVHLALWQLARPASLDWLDALDLDEIDDLQETFPVVDLTVSIPAALRDAGYPDDGRAATLAEEISTQARLFARIMQSDAVRIRLEIVETDACRKFHMDNVRARMIIPLTEPGTEWIEVACGQDASVRRLRAGDVGLFKGRIWAEEPAILHRSPPIAGTGISRLLLVLDLPFPALPSPMPPETF